MATIQPGNIYIDVRNHLGNDPTNPDQCACGWYIYYSNGCGHVYEDYKHACGGTRTKSGKSGFCKSPAPRHNVQTRIAGNSPLC
ncbi:uncharacterized protein BDR25DRAFT_244073 [Lindgomyces ingoldianus]|uniref:Uncharacterized protein n=1 Tax=Lindgomyces ingoldianus TaxID=673940 RepID=A0ACB6QAJ4_9PLEO|nr:uncharacterized protein BDR25DRAFT_244073 [Lindgomyces ingoldianus]KAF2463936.1 hypothetical protein BDR25DRAFT_244073 [Lindgomyces ingoldianus]